MEVMNKKYIETAQNMKKFLDGSKTINPKLGGVKKTTPNIIPNNNNISNNSFVNSKNISTTNTNTNTNNGYQNIVPVKAVIYDMSNKENINYDYNNPTENSINSAMSNQINSKYSTVQSHNNIPPNSHSQSHSHSQCQINNSQSNQNSNSNILPNSLTPALAQSTYTNALTPIYIKYSKQIPHDYLLEIWETLREDELKNMPNFDQIKDQTDINDKMRSILIDWIIDVHLRFGLKTETLFLTVNIIDRYISTKPILRSRFQLVGIAALFIACKYEEIFYPEVKEFVNATDKTYTKKEVIQAEREILFTLNFNLTVSSPYRFFEIISLNFNFNEVELAYGKYLLEYYLIDLKMNKYSPSLISLAVTYIIMKINGYKDYPILYTLLNKSDVNSNQKNLKECAKEIYYLIENSKSLNYKAVLRKYSLEKNFKVAIYGIGKAME